MLLHRTAPCIVPCSHALRPASLVGQHIQFGEPLRKRVKQTPPACTSEFYIPFYRVLLYIETMVRNIENFVWRIIQFNSYPSVPFKVCHAKANPSLVHFNTLPASDDFCHVSITFASSLEPRSGQTKCLA